MKKKVLLVALSASMVGTVGVAAAAGNAIANPFVAGDTPCSHIGNHYAAKGPTNEESGHYEFWSCCKCHETFTSFVEGSWTNTDFSKVVGWNAENPAYIAPLGTMEKQSVVQYSWDETNNIFVAKTENAEINLPTLPTGSTFVSAKVGETALTGTTMAGGKLAIPAAAYGQFIGENNVDVTMALGGENYTFTVPSLFVTAEIATAKQFSYVHWTNEAGNGKTAQGKTHPFVVDGKYIGGYFVMTGDVNLNGSTINERDSDLSYAGKPVSSGWNGDKGFRGTFDGQDHVFDDITFVSTGLFGSIGRGGVVKNFDITCSNGSSTRVHQAMGEACMIATQVFKATIEGVNVIHYGDTLPTTVAGNKNGIFVGDMIDEKSTIKDCTIKVRIGYNNIFGSRTKATNVNFQNVTVEVFKQWTSDLPKIVGITSFCGGYNDTYPETPTTPTGVTLVNNY
ncbi:MAG: hypothetical protein MJ239_01900 [Bacilli bacterium]|nr:hypothetical protein [Bacilli bacterium]